MHTTLNSLDQYAKQTRSRTHGLLGMNRLLVFGVAINESNKFNWARFLYKGNIKVYSSDMILGHFLYVWVPSYYFLKIMLLFTVM